MDTVYSLASGSLGATAVVLVWLLSHSKQIRQVLDLLPVIVRDVERAKAAIEAHEHAHQQEAATSPGPGAAGGGQ